MALKKNGNRAMSSNSNKLHRSAVINNARGLQALGDISRINPESRPSASPFSQNFLQQPMAAPNSLPGLPPPLPPRRSAYMPTYNSYNPMPNFYSPFSRFTPGYPSYRMSPYGAGYGMSPYGAGSDTCSSFAQMAEESTRPAFESIESVVNVVSSISLMLESTYHAVHSSYNAILGVVDQFSRLKDHFAQILSTLALLRWLRWLCLKVLYLLGMHKENPSVQAAWETAEKLANSSIPVDVPNEVRGSAWPFFMFLGLVVGAPWLMFKLLAKSIGQPKPFDPRAFKDTNGKHYFAIAAYDFKATQTGELSFRAGERLMISPRSLRSNPRGGWLFASNEKKETGLIPSTYLQFSNRNTSRNVPMLHRSLGPEENVNIPKEPVSGMETMDNVDDPVDSSDNPFCVLVEKSADSPGINDVVAEKPVEPAVRNPDSKSKSNIGSD